jgi:hypothetical protein
LLPAAAATASPQPDLIVADLAELGAHLRAARSEFSNRD